MSDTPRTMKVLASMPNDGFGLDKAQCIAQWFDHARQLERELSEANARIEKLEGALRPFAFFAEQWERQPISRLHDDIYTIHAGSEFEATLSRSDCFAARAALEKS